MKKSHLYMVAAMALCAAAAAVSSNALAEDAGARSKAPSMDVALDVAQIASQGALLRTYEAATAPSFAFGHAPAAVRARAFHAVAQSVSPLPGAGASCSYRTISTSAQMRAPARSSA